MSTQNKPIDLLHSQSKSFISNLTSKTTDQLNILIYEIILGKSAALKYDIARLDKNRVHYAKTYNLTYFRQQVDRNFSAAVWQKISDAGEMVKNHDWIWLIDSDALIMNGSISIASLLNRYDQESGGKADIIVSKDCNGINAGSLLLRNSEWTSSFVKVWMKGEYRKDILQIEYWREQAMLTYLVNQNIMRAQDHIYYPPQKDINAFAGDYCGYAFQPGDFVIHAPNRGFQACSDYIRALNMIEY